MKRISVEEGSPPKRPRLESGEDNLFNEARRRSASDLLDPATDETGNIEAKVHMVFPCIGGKRQVNLEMREDGNSFRFLIYISSKVDQLLLPFPFSIGDRICLSLKGVRIRSRAPSSALFYLPVVLTFKIGMAAMLMSGPKAGRVFSTWNVGWFDTTDDIPRITDIAWQESTKYVEMMPNTNPPPESPQPEIVANQKAREGPAPVIPPHQHCNASVADLPQSGAQPPEIGRTRAQRRRRNRQARKGELAAQTFLEAGLESGGYEMATPRAEAAASRAPSPPQTVVQLPPQIQPNERASSSLSSEQTSPSSSNRLEAVAASSPPPTGDPARNHQQGALAMMAGITTQGGDVFTPIRKIDLALGFFNVIGVVTSARPATLLHSQERSRIFSIIDPSCVEDDVHIVNYNLFVNCFQKKHAEWLPQAEVGDVVVFRRLKASAFRGSDLNGTVYGDKLRWATYDTKTRHFRDPDRKDAPDSETFDDGVGYSYSPYYAPSMQGKEAEYCAQLADWWQATQAKQQGISIVQCAPRPLREHHLNAGRLATTMQPGEFWSLPNTRVMGDSYRYIYGKLVETHKSKKLDEVQNSENLHFRALLERKKKFQPGEGGSSGRFDKKLVEDVDKEVAG